MVIIVVLLLGAAAPAAAKLKTYTLRHGPVAMGGFNVRFANPVVRSPRVDGYIVRMHARLVDAKGRRVTVSDVMLHHVVFRRRWRPRARRECSSPTGEAFYGSGEENQALRLPAGHGYRIRARHRWRMTAMLMSHSRRLSNVYVQYRVAVETRARLTPVHAFWVRANGCGPKISYPIYGGGPPGSTNVRAFSWRVPYSGRIVAAGGHLHGAAKDMWLSQPRCGDRRLLDNRPFYGMPDHLYYRAVPTLHEPGPVDTSYFMSRTGIPVIRGETLRLTATYDAERPHPRVMAITHVYLAPARRVPRGCDPLPADRLQLKKYGRVRAEPPQVTVPLTGLDEHGGTYSITAPPWPVRPLSSGAVVDLGDRGFVPPHISLRSGSVLTWRFTSRTPHNVSFASGPRLMGSPTLSKGRTYTNRFGVPGRYELFCYLHPVTMHQVVEVLPNGSG